MSKRLSKMETYVLFGTVIDPNADYVQNLDIETIEQVNDANRELKNERVTPHFNSSGVMVNGIKYPSMVAAAKAFNCKHATFKTYANGKNKLPVGNTYGIEEIVYNGKKITPNHMGNSVPIEINGISYPSMTIASKTIGINNGSLCDIATGKKPLTLFACNKYGIHAITFKGKTITADKIKNHTTGSPIVIDGVEYPSMSQAMIELKCNILKQYVSGKVKFKKNNKHNIHTITYKGKTIVAE